MNAAVILASAGRPDLLAEVMRDVDAQTVPLAARILSVPDEASLPADVGTWSVITGTRGLAAQRNAGLDALPPGVDVVVFFDDDAVVREDYVAEALAAFGRDEGLAALTGRVLLDGAASQEIPRDVAVRTVADSLTEPRTRAIAWSRTLYGCNFAVHLARSGGERFDDRLPLYSWLEDHDIARRIMKRARLGRVHDCVIVHRGASSGGRTNHVRLGYSQVMNPVYLLGKRSFPLWLTAWEIFRPTSKNVLLSIAGGSTAWRRPRLRGNLLAVGDIARGRLTPERISRL